MGQSSGRCYVKGCKAESSLFLHKAIDCVECKTYNRLIICSEHAKDIYYICPKTKAIECYYYRHDYVSTCYNVALKIQDNYVYFNDRDNYVYFNDRNLYFYNRYKQIYQNFYKLYVSDIDDILYDLTFDFMLDELKKCVVFYLNILPKDIFELIKTYL
jgi:hypothetical protein